jgi:hypothetical protein
MRKLFLLALGVIFLVGCTHHFETIPAIIAPTVKGEAKPAPKTAIYFAPPLAQYEVITKPQTQTGSKHMYYYYLGPALKTALTESVEAAFGGVAVLEGLPRPGPFDRILRFQLKRVNVQLGYIPGYLHQEAKADAAITVFLEVIDGTSYKTLRKMTVTGHGSYAEDATNFTAYSSTHFTRAIENATQELANVTTNLLISGGADVRAK